MVAYSRWPHKEEKKTTVLLVLTRFVKIGGGFLELHIRSTQITL